MVSSVRSMFVAVCAVLLAAANAAEAQAPVMNPAVVSGANVTFSWSATAGATAYRLEAGVAPGQYQLPVPVGNVTSYAAVAPLVGTYFVRVVALTPAGDVPSLEISVAVTSLVDAPAVPTNLSVARNGVGIVATWSPGAGGGPTAGYRLSVDLPQGGTTALNLGSASFAYAPVPPGAYNFRVAALHAGGASADPGNVLMTMPAGGACDAPPAPVVSQSIFGGFVNLTWPSVPGAAAYVLTGYQNGNFIGSVTLGGATSRFSIVLPQATWRIDVAAVFSCGAQGPPASANFVVDQNSLKMQPREPDPAPGTALPAPAYIGSVVNDIAARYPNDLRNSCKEFGGNNRWLFRLVEELRKRDKRWGLNWKRANFGDMSQDVVTYNWGDEGDEGTFRLRAWDVIGGHCGPRPGGQASEITDPRPPGLSNGARWTLIPYIEAGFIP